MAFTYQYPAHYVSVDTVIFGADSRRESCDLGILLVERGDPSQPFAGAWALPGGFVDPAESLDDAAKRELSEETGVESAFLEQLFTFGAPRRDPRGRVITVAYYALVNRVDCTLRAGSDAARAQWFELSRLPALAFDHAEIIAKAVARLRAKIRYEPIGFNLLPERFTLAQLHTLYESLLDRPIDLPNFRRAILRMGLLREGGEEKDVSHRPAKLFRFDEKRYAQLVRRGFNFEI
jgi:8-oxo-dGTP diphosphatase